jgi:hypothetical protein
MTYQYNTGPILVTLGQIFGEVYKERNNLILDHHEGQRAILSLSQNKLLGERLQNSLFPELPI